jgi:asparaginyl-tRNA synthetase
VFRVRTRLAFAIHEFFQSRGFLYVHAPIITGSDCEGAGELFRVSTLDPKAPALTPEGKVDYAQDFFARPTFLTVSGQLEAEAFATALSNVYTFGPTFRAENSNTSRHAAEFWMIEPEMAFCDLLGRHGPRRELREAPREGRADELRRRPRVLRHVCRQGRCCARLDFVLDRPFQRCSYTEAIEILNRSGRTWEHLVQSGRQPPERA